jgi:arylamine N-acetyltransferase
LPRFWDEIPDLFDLSETEPFWDKDHLGTVDLDPDLQKSIIPLTSYFPLQTPSIERMIFSSPMQVDRTLVPLPEEVTDHYLAILGVARREPSLEALRELLAAHLTRIPFENISKLYYRKRLGLVNLPAIRLYLDGIDKYHFGGTCYSNNYYFYLLLRSLGYQAKLCASDMKTPQVHALSMIVIEGREYMADTGYAAPLLEPIPRDLATDYETALGRDRYVLKPQDANGCSRLELYRDGVLRHGYQAKAAPKTIKDFSKVIAASFSADATFLNSVLLVRFYPGRSVLIHNLTLVESEGNKSTIHALANRDQLIDAIERRFEMPRKIVSEAVRQLGNLQDAWS